MRFLALLVVGWALAMGLAAAQESTVHKITLPQSVPVIPEGPNRAYFTSSCVICHSARLVLGQPRMPAKDWEAIVTKMRKMYGAPVDDKTAALVVEYLVAVRGPASKP